MANQVRVCWLHHSRVYHRARYRDRAGAMIVPCGVLAHTAWYRAKEASEPEARRLGLRPCSHCFKR